MASATIPGFDTPIDPDLIEKVEISPKENPHVTLSIFLKGAEGPLVATFETRRAAIRCYESIWQLRQSDNERILEVGDFG